MVFDADVAEEHRVGWQVICALLGNLPGSPGKFLVVRARLVVVSESVETVA